jgi:hypothetical protein
MVEDLVTHEIVHGQLERLYGWLGLVVVSVFTMLPEGSKSSGTPRPHRRFCLSLLPLNIHILARKSFLSFQPTRLNLFTPSPKHFFFGFVVDLQRWDRLFIIQT